MTGTDLTVALARLPGRTVRSVRRIFYAAPSGLDTSAGPVELETVDRGAAEPGSPEPGSPEPGSPEVVRLDAGPDGETLVAFPEAWRDPFAGPLSAENAEFVARAGRWTAVDVSGQDPYAALVGQTAGSVTVTSLPDGRPTGVSIGWPSGARMTVRVVADELHVGMDPA